MSISSSVKIGFSLLLSSFFLTKGHRLKGRREKRAVRNYLHSENESRDSVRRNVHHTEHLKCIL